MLKTPPGWEVQSRTTVQPASTDLVFAPPSGDSFSLQITVVWLDRDTRAGPAADLRARAMEMAQEPLKEAVEKTVLSHTMPNADLEAATTAPGLPPRIL